MLQLYQQNNAAVLLRDQLVKDERHRLITFLGWLDHTQRAWYQPDIGSYRDYLLHEYQGQNGEPLAPNSVRAHLSTVRARYRAVLRDARTRDALYAMTPQQASPADRKALVDEVIERIRNAIDPEASPVRTIKQQDVADDAHVRLTEAQANELMTAPGMKTLRGIRDTALISLMLCTGLREAELCALNVDDLRQRLGGELALLVREGKGAKQRLIPYGALQWVLLVVDIWLQHAGIEHGAVFRGFYRGARRVRSARLSIRSVNFILDQYPISIDDAIRTVNPHDLRRTYARRLYDAGTDLLAIRDNLGHADTRTTLRYIGTMDASKRRPSAVFRPLIRPDES